MSLFKSILGVAAPIVGGIFGGPAGAALGASLGGAINKPKLTAAPMGFSQSGGMVSTLAPMGLGALPAVIPAAGVAVRAGIMGARAIARSAMTYCRRHPAWCASIGGTAAVAGLIESGQLPAIRRRRGRGITPRDLRSFRRVANTIRVFCPTVRRVPARALHVRRTGITHA